MRHEGTAGLCALVSRGFSFNMLLQPVVRDPLGEQFGCWQGMAVWMTLCFLLVFVVEESQLTPDHSLFSYSETDTVVQGPTNFTLWPGKHGEMLLIKNYFAPI